MAASTHLFALSNTKRPKWNVVGMSLTLVVLALATLKDATANGDFIGYLNAGNLVLQGENIYSDYLNTWPPFFSIMAVPLAMLDHFSPYLVRLLWLMGSCLALYAVMFMACDLFLKLKLLPPYARVTQPTEIAFAHPLVLLPTLLSLRFLLDNSSHVQINLYMLVLAFGSVYLYYKGKLLPAALLLGFSIAIKVFTVFVLLYFLYKRAWRMGLFTLSFVGLFCASTAVVFGVEEAIALHELWFAKSVVPLPDAIQMNQSLLAAFIRLLTDAPTGIDFQINLVTLEDSTVKRIYYVVFALAAAYPLYAFRKSLKRAPMSVAQMLQWSILFTVVPILSPVAWKPYFVFLWIPFFVLNLLIFRLAIPHKRRLLWKWLFFASLPCLILSSELFTGVYFSDVLEVCNAVTLGTLLLLLAQISLYMHMPKEVLERNVSEYVRLS
jgi:hypothetical protein